MNNTKPKFKEDLACNISLIAVLIFTVVHLIIITLSFMCKININLYDEFNHIVAFVLIGVCLLLYILGFFTYKLTNVYIPSWFRILFYIAFFLFTNVYYILGLHLHLAGLIFLFAYFAFLICIICLSVYFNIQKDTKNKLKTIPKHLIVNVFLYSIAVEAIFQLIINVLKIILFKSYAFADLVTYVIEFGTMFVVNIFMTLLFALSLYSSKRFVNACLIKVNKSSND